MVRLFRGNLKSPHASPAGQLFLEAACGSQAQVSEFPNSKKDGSPGGIVGAALGII